MMGIINDDFELLLKKNRTMLEALLNDIKDLKSNSLNINSNFNNDLSFVNFKLLEIIDQLDKISKKVNGYYSTLNSIYNSYNEQSKQILIDTKKLIS